MPRKTKKKKAEDVMIFTSPDGGETVYGQTNGRGPKVLISKSNKATIEEEHQRRQYYMTERAVEMCWKHKGLQKAWEKYIVLLELYGYEE